jgi:tetrahydromethanopterin S-methyltransferase subunit A
VLGGPESAGHLTGEALKALFHNGVDERKRIQPWAEPANEKEHEALKKAKELVE